MQSRDTATSAPLPATTLIWMAIALFSTGIDGYVLAGLLPAIADDLTVTEAMAGQLVSVFALTSALAGPVLGALTGGWERRRTISSALAVFVIGNVVTAVAPTLALALTGRVVAALGGCLLSASINAYVIHRAPPHQRGRALSFVLGGWMTATALGVPVGLVLGQTNWRIPLVMVSVVGTIALVGIVRRLPTLHLPASTLVERLRPLRNPRLAAGLGVTTGILCASYTCFTYAVLILGPVLKVEWMIVVVMFGYGLASMLGNALTGRLVDRFSPVRILTIWLIGLLVNALVGSLSVALAGGIALTVLSLAWFGLAGVGNGGAAVPQQARLAAMAPESAPVVMALNGSAISLGTALGGGLGGLVLAGGTSPQGLLPVAACLLVLTLGVHIGVVLSGPRPVAADHAR